MDLYEEQRFLSDALNKINEIGTQLTDLYDAISTYRRRDWDNFNANDLIEDFQRGYTLPHLVQKRIEMGEIKLIDDTLEIYEGGKLIQRIRKGEGEPQILWVSPYIPPDTEVG